MSVKNLKVMCDPYANGSAIASARIVHVHGPDGSVIELRWDGLDGGGFLVRGVTGKLKHMATRVRIEPMAGNEIRVTVLDGTER